MAFEFLLLQTEFLLNRFDRVPEELLPFGIRQRELIGIELPDSPDIHVNESLLALPVRGLLAERFQCLRLLCGERQANWSEAGDFQTGVGSAIAPGRTERTGTVDFLHRRIKLF